MVVSPWDILGGTIPSLAARRNIRLIRPTRPSMVLRAGAPSIMDCRSSSRSFGLKASADVWPYSPFGDLRAQRMLSNSPVGRPCFT